MKRTPVTKLKDKQDALIRGWVFESRVMSKMAFLLIRDSSGMIQCIVKNDMLLKKLSGITLESVVEVRGKVKKATVKAELALKNFELEVKDINVLNKAEKLPIQVNEKAVVADLPNRLDNRSLDIRKPRVHAIFKIQSTIANAFREYFYKSGFIEIQPPGIIATSTEGGTELFEAKYFNKKAYLAQSPQLYKQLAAISWEKVFSISPVWRAEKHDTSKHINECRQMDIECAFNNDIEIMKHLEGVVRYIVKAVIENNKEELKILKRSLRFPDVKYLTYKEAVDVVNKYGFIMKYGEDFEPEAERKLCEIYKDTIVFTYEWPIEIKPFYIWLKDKKKGISGGFDALYGGIEISSGGQRVHDPVVLIEMLKLKKLNPKDFKWYIDAFRFGAPYHSGWSIGLERLTQAILELDNIRECTLFPRDKKRLTP